MVNRDNIDGIQIVHLYELLGFASTLPRPVEVRRLSYLDFMNLNPLQLTDAEKNFKERFMPKIDIPYIEETPGKAAEPFGLLDGRPWVTGYAAKQRHVLARLENKGVWRRRDETLGYGAPVVVPISGTVNAADRNTPGFDPMDACMIRVFQEGTGYTVTRIEELTGMELENSSRRQIDGFVPYLIEMNEFAERQQPTDQRGELIYIPEDDWMQLLDDGGIKSDDPDEPGVILEGCSVVATLMSMLRLGQLIRA